ncbi:MAG TPA: hypothetical protein ACFYEK_11080 [Candidatus Wunengus sp. YC60]|uniref:hypothetical protein n=1 Tax=Candidatus Wunengus sp. YC60 TaxID=3367697 RepID=UPI004024EA5B
MNCPKCKVEKVGDHVHDVKTDIDKWKEFLSEMEVDHSVRKFEQGNITITILRPLDFDKSGKMVR